MVGKSVELYFRLVGSNFTFLQLDGSGIPLMEAVSRDAIFCGKSNTEQILIESCLHRTVNLGNLFSTLTKELGWDIDLCTLSGCSHVN